LAEDVSLLSTWKKSGLALTTKKPDKEFLSGFKNVFFHPLTPSRGTNLKLKGVLVLST